MLSPSQTRKTRRQRRRFTYTLDPPVTPRSLRCLLHHDLGTVGMLQDSCGKLLRGWSSKRGTETEPRILEHTMPPRPSTPGPRCHHAVGGYSSLEQFKPNGSLQPMETQERERAAVTTLPEMILPRTSEPSWYPRICESLPQGWP